MRGAQEDQDPESSFVQERRHGCPERRPNSLRSSGSSAVPWPNPPPIRDGSYKAVVAQGVQDGPAVKREQITPSKSSASRSARRTWCSPDSLEPRPAAPNHDLKMAAIGTHGSVLIIVSRIPTEYSGLNSHDGV